MKIGVVTYWYGNSNYGMILQCWALQEYLKKQGHEPFVIRYEPKGPWIVNFAKRTISFLMCLVSKSKRMEAKKHESLLGAAKINDEKRRFEQFRQDNLKLSEMYYEHLSELRKNPPIADCYIAGSDQIWSGGVKYDDSLGYYLAFGDEKVNRIAYAPGMGAFHCAPNMTQRYKKALGNFDYLSCREYDGVEECRKYGFDAVKVEDPTLLLNRDDYESLMEPVDKKDFIFIYSVNMRSSEDIYWKDIKRIFADKAVVVTPASGAGVGSEMFGDNVDYFYATPGEWLSLINSSDMVITSSFHGVVFSLIYNKKFAFVPLKGAISSTNNRIIDLLKGLNLEELIIANQEDYNRVMNTTINWGEVNKKKNILIQSSMSFLNKALAPR